VVEPSQKCLLQMFLQVFLKVFWWPDSGA